MGDSLNYFSSIYKSSDYNKWSNRVSYDKGAIVCYEGVYYSSNINLNRSNPINSNNWTKLS